MGSVPAFARPKSGPGVPLPNHPFRAKLGELTSEMEKLMGDLGRLQAENGYLRGEIRCMRLQAQKDQAIRDQAQRHSENQDHKEPESLPTSTLSLAKYMLPSNPISIASSGRTSTSSEPRPGSRARKSSSAQQSSSQVGSPSPEGRFPNRSSKRAHSDGWNRAGAPSEDLLRPSSASHGTGSKSSSCQEVVVAEGQQPSMPVVTPSMLGPTWEDGEFERLPSVNSNDDGSSNGMFLNMVEESMTPSAHSAHSYVMTSTTLTDGRRTIPMMQSSVSRDSFRGASFFPEYFAPTKKVQVSIADTRFFSSTSDDETGDGPSRFVLSPVGTLRLGWDIISLLALLCDFWSTSFVLIFLDPGKVPRTGFLLMNLITTFFLADILLNFNTGYVVANKTYMHRRRIVRRYLQLWFWVDLLATCPFDLVLAALTGGEHPRSMDWVARMPRVLKVLRCLRMVQTFTVLSVSSHPDSSRESFIRRSGAYMKHLGKLMLMLFCLTVLAHIHGCARAILLEGSSQQQDWRAALEGYYEHFWWAYCAFAFGPQEATAGGWGLWTLDIVLASERVMLMAIFGVCGVQQALIQKERDIRFTEKEDDTMAYLKRHSVSTRTQIHALQVLTSLRKTRAYRNRTKHFTDFASTFPEDLRRQICEEMWAGRLTTLALVRMIQEWDSLFVPELSLHVHEEMHVAKDVLCREGEASHSAYRILQGCIGIHVQDPTLTPVPDFTEGMWVGEKALINPDLRRSATLVAVAFTTVMVVPAESFRQLLQRFGLLQKFEDICEDHLWKGLCGRCGTFGNHFSDVCPLVKVKETMRSMRSRRLVTFFASHGDEQSKNTELLNARRASPQVDKTLAEFLRVQGLQRVEPQLAKMGITTIAALEGTEAERLRSALDLTEAEVLSLSEEAFEGFKIRFREATRNMMGRSRPHHLLFLSHYKVEAGTEAALMRAELEKLMDEDPCSLGHIFDVPIFLDSEDLTDLRILRERVFHSHNIVLLLTKGVFERPWVLVEIVTAARCGRPVLPVMVEKAGVRFEFPNESFYESLFAGDRLSSEDLGVLTDCGISLEEVVGTMKNVLKHIAVPYSPHKSAQIRRAELQALLDKATLCGQED